MSDELLIRVVDKSHPSSYKNREDWFLKDNEVALIINSSDMLIFGCGQYRAQVSQFNSRKWSYRVWNVIGGDTIIAELEQGKRRAVSQCVAAIAVVAGIVKQDESGEWHGLVKQSPNPSEAAK